jgi:lipopolysaccharide biosynthesis protein
MTSDLKKSNEIPQLIAFYLPQFHPTVENDKWWGKGFTEWTNVTKSAPLFEGHYQPHLPADLGFYDLRVEEVQKEQVEMARLYGIDGFCYHYYWFSGVRVLNKPLDSMLTNKSIEMPFCLSWANENWTRRWDGQDKEILLDQKYLTTDDLNFIKSLVPFFKDDRYIRVEGALLLIVYKPQDLPNPRKSVALWREYCREEGLGELHVCAALTYGNDTYAHWGFDSGVEFPLHNHPYGGINKYIAFFSPFRGILFQYSNVARHYLGRKYKDLPVFRCVLPSWDNTARRGDRATVILNGTPNNYEVWLSETVRRARTTPENYGRLIFINAWNEWAEGCHLEPDRRYGRNFLEATRTAKYGVSKLDNFPDISLPASKPRHFLADLFEVLKYHSWISWDWIKMLIIRSPTAKYLAGKIIYLFRKLL